MSKKILVISSSHRKGGNSDSLCDEFIKGAVESGNDVEKIALRDKKINYCLGCGACNNNNYGGCVQKDDVNEIVSKMVDSDVIVFATPIYFYTMSGQMKTFIDRCCSKYTKISNKEFYLIMTAADGREQSFYRAVEEFQGFFACLEGVTERGLLLGAGVWQVGDVKATKYMEKAYEMGKAV